MDTEPVYLWTFMFKKIGLKEYFTLNWHRGFNRANAWIKAGGVRPEDCEQSVELYPWQSKS